jgi:hypothetical protein
VEILDYISENTDSEDVLPFAMRLVENGEVIQIAEDNGEVACGELLSNVLNQYEGYNMLVCVSRRVDGCFVSEMIQNFKLRVIKEAAVHALDNIFLQFNPRALSLDSKGEGKAIDDGEQHKDGPTERKFGPRDYVVSKRVTTLKREIEKAKVIIDPFASSSTGANHAAQMKKLRAAKGKLIKLSDKLATSKLG